MCLVGIEVDRTRWRFAASNTFERVGIQYLHVDNRCIVSVPCGRRVAVFVDVLLNQTTCRQVDFVALHELHLSYWSLWWLVLKSVLLILCSTTQTENKMKCTAYETMVSPGTSERENLNYLFE